MVKEKISLTQELSVMDGSHILYFHSSYDNYIENVVSFVETGVRLNQHVILIDSFDRFSLIQPRLEQRLTSEQLDGLHFIDNHDFYGLFGDFHFERVLANLQNAVQPFVDQKVAIRLWGHVDWNEQSDVLSKLHRYECQCDLTVSELGFLTVCAYNGLEVPAYIQQEMMKTHEYFMTDTELVRSSLYRSATIHPTVFPSISVQGSLESEMDLYKQKLDFVHVVSHEVRNPLTIIKAYSSLLQREENDAKRRKKLQDIYDYAVVIDNEISHIISTEQMLSTEAFWVKKLCLPQSLVQEALEIVEIKARTQNIRLDYDLKLSGNETIISNRMGFKLIVSNILNNAINYSHEGGTVTFACYVEDHHLIMETHDQGIGMSDEQVQRLFNKYEKMNDERTGQGIGLYMVKKLLDHFDGDIEVHSVLDVGSTFRVRIPLSNSNSH